MRGQRSVYIAFINDSSSLFPDFQMINSNFITFEYTCDGGIMKMAGGGGGGVVSALRFDDDTDHSAGRSRAGGGHSIVLGCWVCHYVCLFFTFSVSSQKDF